MDGSRGSRCLDGKIAIITGAGHGIGRSYALRFAREGASVAVVDIDKDGAMSVAAEITNAGGTAAALHADVSDSDSVTRMVEDCVSQYGGVDILVNNAALFATIPMSRAPFDEIDVDEWDRMMAINLRGPWLVSRAVFPVMKMRAHGKIINISSGTALKGSASRIHYVTSKAGILGFTRTLAREVGPFGISVNCVAPGSTLSEESPDDETLRMRQSAAEGRALARVQTPSDLEGAVVFLASDDSDFITGQTLVVDGGSFMH